MRRFAHGFDTPIAVPLAVAGGLLLPVVASLIQGLGYASPAWVPVALVVGLVLLGWRIRHEFVDPGEIAIGARLAATAIGCSVLPLAGVFFSPWVGVVALAAVLPLAAFSVGGWRWLSAATPMAAFTAAFAFVPFLSGTGFSTFLQTAASKAADKILDLWGVFHLIQGSSIAVSDRRLFLEEAIHGVHPMAAVLIGAAFGLVWAGRPLWLWIAVLFSVPCWTIAADSLRRAMVALLVDQYRIQADRGAVQGSISLATIALALGLTFSFAALLQAIVRFFNRPATGSFQNADEPRPSVVPPAWVIRSFIAASALSLVLQAPRWFQSTTFEPRNGAGRAAVGADAQALLPENFAEFRRTAFREGTRDRFDVERDSVKTWEFKSGWSVARFDVERSVRHWLELPNGYRSTGWILRDRTNTSFEIGGESLAVVEISLNKPSTGRAARLWHLLVQPSGKSVRAPAANEAGVRRFDPSGLLSTFAVVGNGPFEQLSLAVETAAPLNERATAEARSFFETSCRRVLDAERGTGERP